MTVITIVKTALMMDWESVRDHSNREYARASITSRLRANYKGYAPHDRLCDWKYLFPDQSRGYIKATLKNIGHQLNRFKKSDDVDDALRMMNEIYPTYRDWLDFPEIFECLFDRSFFICNDCGVLEDYDHGNTAYDDYTICESCCDNNYRYSENRGTYITCDDYWEEQDDEEDEDESSIIGSYHSSKRFLGHLPSSFDKHKKPIYLGLELEMEIGEDYSRSDKAQQLIDAIGMAQINGTNYRYAMCEGDGSLDHGFEMVTGYTGLDTHAKQLEFFKKPFRGARSHDTRTCGLHVHICKSDASLLHCAKMVLFINDSSNQKLVRAIARRDGASYSKILNKKASYAWLKEGKGLDKRNRIQRLNNDRYEALNFQNEKTIEFRIFKGTLKYESIMASLEFTYATWHFCRDTGTNDLTTSKFFDFICAPENKKFTRYLRQYLNDKGFALPRSGVIKSNPRINESTPSTLVTSDI